jgi:hypothetical protein
MQKSKSNQKRVDSLIEKKEKRVLELRQMPQKTTEQGRELRRLEGELEMAKNQRLAHTKGGE